MMRLTNAIRALAILSLLAGCGAGPEMNYGNVTLVPVEGTVTLDGKPLPRAVVTFEAEDGTFSYGQTDENGYYELQFDSEMNGVKPGNKLVRISTTRKILGLNTDEGEADGGGETADGKPIKAADTQGELVPEKYNASSELTVEVVPDQATHNFDLES
jgi:hypothetical protein